MMRRVLYACLVLAVLLTVSGMCWCAGTGSLVKRGTEGQALLRARQDNNASAVVSGVVKDADTGEPVEGALIAHTSGAVADFTTGPNGSYRFEGMREGVHIFEVSAEGYKTKTVQVVLTRNSTVAFDIELGEEVEEYNILIWVAVGVLVSLVGLLIIIYYVSGKVTGAKVEKGVADEEGGGKIKGGAEGKDGKKEKRRGKIKDE